MRRRFRVVIALRRPSARGPTGEVRVGLPHLALIAGLALALVAAGSAFAPTPARAALLVAALMAAAGMCGLALFWPGRIVDVLMLLACGLMSLPIDKYFSAGDHVGGWLGYRIAAADLVLMATLPFVAVGWALGRARNRLPWSVIGFYSAWLMVSVVSVLFAQRTDYALMELASLLHAFFVAVVVGAAFPPRATRPLLLVMAAIVVLHSAFAFAQQITGRPIGVAWFGGTGIVNEELVTGESHLRPSGLLDHPIVFASMLVLWLPVFAAGLAVSRSRTWRIVLLAAIALGGVALVLTLSRGAWIGMAAAGAVLVVLSLRHGLVALPQWRRAAIAAAVLGVLLAPALGPTVYGRLTASQSGNVSVRFGLNWIALRMIEHAPVLGIGLGGFVDRMSAFDPTNIKAFFPAPAHNLYLLEAAETGLPGAASMLALFVVVLITGLARLNRLADPGVRFVGAAIIAGLCGFLVAQLSDFSHRLDPLRSVVWMNIGILFALGPTGIVPADQHTARRSETR